MAAVSLTTLRARARARADMPVAGFVADSATELDAWINEGVQKLTEMLIKAYGEEFIEAESAFNTVAGTTDYNLPVDLVALYGVDMTIGGVGFSLMPYPRTERNLYKNVLQGTWKMRPRYKMIGMGPGVLRLLPAPDAAYACKILYAPSAPLLVNVGDTVNFPNGWERYVVVYAAIQCLAKEESATAELRTERAAMEKELAEIAIRRNADQPHQAVDVESVEEDNPLMYLGGRGVWY
jgi:hypothetical protein